MNALKQKIGQRLGWKARTPAYTERIDIRVTAPGVTLAGETECNVGVRGISRVGTSRGAAVCIASRRIPARGHS